MNKGVRLYPPQRKPFLIPFQYTSCQSTRQEFPKPPLTHRAYLQFSRNLERKREVRESLRKNYFSRTLGWTCSTISSVLFWIKTCSWLPCKIPKRYWTKEQAQVLVTKHIPEFNTTNPKQVSGVLMSVSHNTLAFSAIHVLIISLSADKYADATGKNASPPESLLLIAAM
jgi:hypothetical protein